MLQCMRYCWDTKKTTPGLPNCAKYMVTILVHASLGMYRMDPTDTNRIVFTATAVVHGLYASFWDVYYDWNIGHIDSDYRFPRQTRAYNKVWVYYAAIALNSSLRFSWVLYTVFPPQDQHSALVSFGVSLGEVFRRGVWLLIRVESEQCTSLGYPRPCGDILLSYSPSTRYGEEEGANDCEVNYSGEGLLRPMREMSVSQLAATSGKHSYSIVAALPGRPDRTYSPGSPGGLSMESRMIPL
jgi:hypothetical protein